MHEVRVPLNSITLGIDVLQNPNTGKRQSRDTLIMMEEATGFMSHTLNDVLDLQKIEEGKYELTFRPMALLVMLAKVEQLVKGLALSKGIRVMCKANIDVPQHFLSDMNRLIHILANLLNNAIKFTKVGGLVLLQVSLPVEKKPIRYSQYWFNVVPAAPPARQGFTKIQFSIIDEGPGISQPDQERLFKPFSQIRPGDLQQGRGSGVGLNICKTLVQLMEGEVGVESKEGKGSTFYVIMPVQPLENLAPETTTGRSTAPTNVPECPKVQSLLVFEIGGANNCDEEQKSGDGVATAVSLPRGKRLSSKKSSKVSPMLNQASHTSESMAATELAKAFASFRRSTED